MNKVHKENTCFHLDRRYLSTYKDDNALLDYIKKRLSNELSERIMTILDSEDEIVVKQKCLTINEDIQTDSFAYKKQIEWIPLVRCKDCKWKQGIKCIRFASVNTFPDDFCSRGEKENE